MRSNSPGPLVYALPAIVLAAVLLYFLYGTVDRFALNSQQSEARVIDKQVSSGSTTYNTNVAGGRAWSDSTKSPDLCILVLQVDGETAGAAVSRELYDAVGSGDVVHVEFERTRLSNQLVVVNVRR